MSFIAPLTMASIILAVAIYIYFGFRVARARIKYGVQAPSMDGPPEFQRTVRVQANTLEQLVPFAIAAILFGTSVSDPIGGLLGLIWCGARIYYGIAYVRNPNSRIPAFVVSLAITFILLFGSLLGFLSDPFLARFGGGWAS